MYDVHNDDGILCIMYYFLILNAQDHFLKV
jgi:hypothetical protein